MKKSTLITTIAMIVVVVVALSTATYAWFTSASTSTAEGHMTVNSTSGWSIMGAARSQNEGDNTGKTDTVAYDSNTELSLILMSGLYSPTAAISGAISSNALSTTFASLSEWYQAEQTGTGNVTDAKSAAAATIDPIAEDPNIRSSISYIRVENGYAAKKGLRLTITVWIDTQATSIQKAAAQEFCTYISFNIPVDTDSDPATAGVATGFVANTRYDWGELGNVGADDKYPATKNGEANEYSVAASTATTGYKALGGSTAYTTGDLAATFIPGTAAKTGGQYFQYTLDFGDLYPGEAVNIAMYSWFNGWKIDNTASGTDAYVYLSFGDTPAAPQGN